MENKEKKLDVVFADTFFESFEKMINRETKWYWKMYDFFKYNLPWFLKNIFFFRRELWSFRPWGWHDNLRLLKRSLEATEVCVRNGISADREKTADEIKECINLLNNLSEENHIDQAEKILNITSLGNFDFIETDKGTQMKPLTEQEIKVYELADKLEEDQWSEVFHLMKYKMRSWWN